MFTTDGKSLSPEAETNVFLRSLAAEARGTLPWLGVRARSFATNCMDNPRSCSAGVDDCLYSLCRPCFGILGSFVENSTVVSFSPFWSARKHSWKYVLLSALLHDQSRLQSSSCFRHQFVWLPFSRTLVCKGGQQFVLLCSWEHEIRVFEPEPRCCVTLA